MSLSSDSHPAPIADLPCREAFGAVNQPRKILVYAPLAYSTPHFETDLEIAQRHLDLGDDVELVLCDAELSSCQLNPKHELARCVQCVSRSLQGAGQLSERVKVHGLLTALEPEDRARLASLPRAFPSQLALGQFTFDGFDAGMATLSSLIDFTRSLTIDPQVLATVIHRTIHSSVATFLALKRLLAAGRYDRVYIYNGRWSMMRSAVRACEQLGVEYYTHERGADFHKFAIHRNALPHDKGCFRGQAEAAWAHAGGNPQTLPLAESFFTERRQRVEKNWFSYTKQQESGRLPADWDRPARRLVLFTSSEFEFAAIGEGATGRIYPQQSAGLRRLARCLAAQSPATHLWVRVHPNDNNPVAVKTWTETAAGLANVTLILPAEKVDSYSMLDGADRIITFGSTMGIEATYWGKASICADHSFYDGLDAQYEAANETDLIELLCRPGLAPKPRENALRYGFYLNTAGDNFRHFVTDQISDYTFKSPFRGRCLRPDPEDLRQRLLALFQAGDFSRAAAIARLLAEFNAADAAANAILVLSQLKLGSLESAVQSLEAATARLAPPQLEKVLKHTASALLDALMHAAKQAPSSGGASDPARRTGAVLLQSAPFAAVGRKLLALADRNGNAQGLEPQPVGANP